MEKRIRGVDGKYVNKGISRREVRSVRLRDETWECLNDLADRQRITVADLLEEWMSHDDVLRGRKENLAVVIEILEEALKLRPNAGGAIKTKIKEALEKIRETM